MENKFQIFKNAMDELKLESNKHECEILIRLTQEYFSFYQQYKQLDRAIDKLNNIYKRPTLNAKSKIKLCKGQLDIRQRLFLEFYKTLIDKCYEGDDAKEFVAWIEEYEEELPKLIKGFRLENYQIENSLLKKQIAESCQKAYKILKEDKKREHFNLGLDNIRSAVRIYKRYENKKIISEEVSFNSVLSEAFVYSLIGVMKTNEPLLCLYIAPIRGQLCKKEEGGRVINSHTWKWCYEKDFRLTQSNLQAEIECLKKYGILFQRFESISKSLKKLEKQLQFKEEPIKEK